MRYITIPESIRDLLVLDEQTGDVFWRFSMEKVGATIDKKGYLVASGFGKHSYKMHRLVWFLHAGNLPNDDIDHINGNKADNRPCNLRVATRSQNMLNQFKAKRTAPTRFIGVGRNNRSQQFPYRAQLTVNGKQIYLGSFKTADEAHKAYIDKKQQMSA